MVEYDADKLGYYSKEIKVYSNAENGIQQLFITGYIN